MFGMKRFVSPLLLGLALAFGAAQAMAAGDQGGYVGPGPAVVTVEQAKKLKDDAQVTLRGKIVQSLGDDDYLFEDSTGSITVEIDDKRWQGLQVGPDDLVEIQGELDKEMFSIEIDVKRLSKK